MPQFELLLRYTCEWTASIIVRARTAHDAEAKVEQGFADVHDLASFALFVAKDSTPELDEESLDIEGCDEL